MVELGPRRDGFPSSLWSPAGCRKRQVVRAPRRPSVSRRAAGLLDSLLPALLLVTQTAAIFSAAVTNHGNVQMMGLFVLSYIRNLLRSFGGTC